MKKKTYKEVHKEFCDYEVRKAYKNRPIGVMRRPQEKEPTYTNYEMREMLKNLLTKQSRGAILKS